MFDLLRLLCGLSGPSSEEGPVLDAVEAIWKGRGLTTERTRIGNLIGRAGGRGPRVLLAAHADELNYLVRAVDPAGFLWLANGQAWTRTLHVRDWFTVGRKVRILAPTSELPGVIASATGHAATLRLPEPSEWTWDDLWVDTGLTGGELERLGVRPGVRIVWDAPLERLGATMVGKALDDRGGIAVLCELMSSVAPDDLACDLTFVCTVQEEIGVVGAAALAAKEQFDAAVIVESGLAGDVPGLGERALPIRLGAGPSLIHKDSLVHYDHALTARLAEVAGRAGVPVQHAVVGSYGSDGAAFMRADVPTALVTFPTRYTHTPFEMASLRDLEAMVALLKTFVTTPWEGISRR